MTGEFQDINRAVDGETLETWWVWPDVSSRFCLYESIFATETSIFPRLVVKIGECRLRWSKTQDTRMTLALWTTIIQPYIRRLTRSLESY